MLSFPLQTFTEDEQISFYRRLISGELAVKNVREEVKIYKEGATVKSTIIAEAKKLLETWILDRKLPAAETQSEIKAVRSIESWGDLTSRFPLLADQGAVDSFVEYVRVRQRAIVNSRIHVIACACVWFQKYDLWRYHSSHSPSARKLEKRDHQCSVSTPD